MLVIDREKNTVYKDELIISNHTGNEEDAACVHLSSIEEIKHNYNDLDDEIIENANQLYKKIVGDRTIDDLYIFIVKDDGAGNIDLIAEIDPAEKDRLIADAARELLYDSEVNNVDVFTDEEMINYIINNSVLEEYGLEISEKIRDLIKL